MTNTADIEVICPGVLEVLSVGKGDLKLTWEAGDEDKARSTIEEMLRKGYSIFVETDVGPARVQRFSSERMTYIITEVVEGEQLPTGPAEPAKKAAGKTTKATARKTKEKEVPVAGSKARAVGRTAGG